MHATTSMVKMLSAVAGIAAVLILSGCASDGDAAEEQAPQSEQSAAQPDAESTASDTEADSQGTATVTIDGREFEFALRMCSVYDSGEALVSGLGAEVGSDVPSHLDGDAVTFEDGEFRIDIGADGPFQSSDDFLALGSSLGGDFALTEDGAGYVITGQAWSDSGTDLGVGTMRFSCN